MDVPARPDDRVDIRTKALLLPFRNRVRHPPSDCFCAGVVDESPTPLNFDFARDCLDHCTTSPAKPLRLPRTVMFNTDESCPSLVPPQRIPSLNIPHATATVDIKIINTTTHFKTKTENLLDQSLPGHETSAFPSYAFLIRNASLDTNILFDLGMRKDWRRACTPHQNLFITDDGSDAPLHVAVEKDIKDVLTAEFSPANICTQDVSAVIWSSHRFDHRGNISSFPAHTKLIVGPGLLDTYLHREINEREIHGRDILEMTSADFRLSIGGFPAHDAFGDGSFYLLSCPGPSIGHMCGMARVTSDPMSTFVFLGADCAHHCGEFRPSPYVPLPKQIIFKPATWAYDAFSTVISAPVLRSRKILVTDGDSIREKIHPLKSASDSFYASPSEPAVLNYADANESLAKVELFDACPEVLVCLSHDPTLMNVLPFYPFSISDWHKKGYKQRLQWEFLYDFDLGKLEDAPPKMYAGVTRF